MKTPWIEELITQSLEYIVKFTPFGNIPVVSRVINSIAEQSIRIALEKTPLGSYIVKQITDDTNKQVASVHEARGLLQKAVTPEERKKHEEQLKESLRKLFDFKS
jgi:hypothetical protein